MVPSPIFTVGHSTHELPAFVELLSAHGVEQLVDVRRFPASRRVPWFNREKLAAEVSRRGLAYRHLPELGGRRRASPDSPNGGWRVEAFRGYADHMTSREFACGLEALEQLGRRRATAMMCAEGPWWRCHRRLIADALAVRGWDVAHIGPDGRVTPHELTPFATVDEGQLSYPPAQASFDAG